MSSHSMNPNTGNFFPLPTSWPECTARGWTDIDILLVTGDGYVDHPSYGVALVGRLLLSHGYRVAILAQPRFDTAADFASFPMPLLFCGITAGNLDSIVANYSGNGKVRDSDAYSPGGNPWRGGSKSKTERRRPDRACLIYTSLARSVFQGIPFVLGGVEASLRRFVHYDYKQEGLRSSFLTDAKADLLVYGMGEKAILEIAAGCQSKAQLTQIAGTCQRLTDRELSIFFPDFTGKNSNKFLVLSSWDEINVKKDRFLDTEIELDRHARSCSPRIILQRQQTHWVVQHPAATPLTPAELDTLYSLPFTRRPHPLDQEIPAYRMIRDSVTIVRGCSGNCSFCAITRHQGPAIISRSKQSILAECLHIAQMEDFGGTITDLGGPTANLYGTSCAIGSCKKRDCLYPKLCPNLRIDEELFLSLLKEVSRLEGVKHLFISSGLRMELLLRTPRLLETILRSHTPGALKIAPEHSDTTLLSLMHKEPHSLLQNFIKKCREIRKKIGKKIELTPYIIISHPGSTPQLVERLVQDLLKLDLKAKKFQDFTPTPGTLSTAMYVTGLRPDTKQAITVSRCHRDRQKERRILEGYFHEDASHKRGGQRKKK
ncbi:MAG: YgiQ family radical SAM protein [Pseudomonadota bacterium]